MKRTYRAIEVTKPGVFTEVSRPLQDPGPNQVRIRVEACGVCHTDSAIVDGEFPNLTYPRVPGHEIIGRIDAVGTNFKTRSVGQRVGVGIFGGLDGTCVSCLRGDFFNCANPVLTGITIDGGYAEVMIIDARSTVRDEAFHARKGISPPDAIIVVGAHGLSELPVVGNIDPKLPLFPHDGGDRAGKAFFIGGTIRLLRGCPSPVQCDEVRRPGKASRVCRDDPVRATLHVSSLGLVRYPP
jgi:hypothetical protein